MHERRPRVSTHGTIRILIILAARVLIRSRAFALGLLLVLASLPASICTAEDLIEVYRSALVNDPTYAAGMHQRQSSLEVYKQARSTLLPALSASASYIHADQDIVSSDNTVFASGSTDFGTADYTVSLTQSIYDFSNWARLFQAKEKIRQVDAEWLAVQQDLMLRVAEAYFGALAVQQDLVSIQAEEKAVEAQYQFIEAKYARGLASQTDYLDAEARFLQVGSRALEIRSRLRDALQSLAEMTGAAPRELSLLADEFPMGTPEPADPTEWLKRANEFNPELLTRRQAVEVAKREVAARQGGHLPSLDLSFNYNYNDTDGSLFGGGSEVETQEVMVSVNVPIFSGGLVSSRVREASALFKRARDELLLEQRAVQRETYAAFDGILTDIRKARSLRKSVEAYTSGVKVKRTGFESGRTSGIAVLDAERDLFFARSEHARARFGYVLNTLRLKRAVGLLSEDDLQQLNNALSAESTALVPNGAADEWWLPPSPSYGESP